MPGNPRSLQGDLAAGSEARVAFHVAIDGETVTRNGPAVAIAYLGAAQGDLGDLGPVKAQYALDHRQVEVEDALGSH